MFNSIVLSPMCHHDHHFPVMIEVARETSSNEKSDTKFL